MRERDPGVRPRRRRVVATSGDRDGPILPDPAEDPAPSGPDRRRAADPTRILTGFAHPAVILDAWSRRAVGRALSGRIDAGLAAAALEAAIAGRAPPPGGVHRSDRGPRHASGPYRAKLRAHGPEGSTGRRGNPYDDARAESLVRTPEREEVHPNGHGTFRDVPARLPRFLEGAYSAERPHPALGYLSPARLEGANAREAA